MIKRHALAGCRKSAAAFASYTNVYAPYYRQISGAGIAKAETGEGLLEMCRNNVPRTDVFAVLDYYFENWNGGRPYLLAGHSQGSCLLKLVLSEYMVIHPAYYARMAACYAIGYYFPEAWFRENPHVKKATGEQDTGVLITWNTKGPGFRDANLPPDGAHSYVINPLNRKTDGRPAGVTQNLGTALPEKDGTIRIVPGKADATADPAKGTLLCSTVDPEDYIPENPVTGKNSLHFSDWSFYYENIRENGEKRLAAFRKAGSR